MHKSNSALSFHFESVGWKMFEKKSKLKPVFVSSTRFPSLPKVAYSDIEGNWNQFRSWTNFIQHTHLLLPATLPPPQGVHSRWLWAATAMNLSCSAGRKSGIGVYSRSSDSRLNRFSNSGGYARFLNTEWNWYWKPWDRWKTTPHIIWGALANICSTE